MFRSRSVFLASPVIVALAAAGCSTEMGPSEDIGSASEAVTSCAAIYGQCGGQGWAGPTCCVASTCTVQNPFYSQCVASGTSGSSSGSTSGTASGSTSGTASGTTSGSTSGSATTAACPTDSNDAQERAAANAAFSILKAAAIACKGAVAGPCWGSTILASQRYAVSGSPGSIIFDPADPQYAYVPQAAKVALAVAQLDSTVAAYLVAGLTWAQSKTNGQLYPSIMPASALASFNYPGNSTAIPILDPNVAAKVRTDVVTGSAWCNTEAVHFADTSSNETGFAAINEISYTNFLNAPRPAYKVNGDTWPSTPFNGSGANPYLVVSLNGAVLNWNSKSWATQNCSGSTKCSATLDLDPIPYSQPGAYYDVNNSLVGPQVNPYSLVITNLYSDPSHQGQWATRTVSGVQQWGTFTLPINILGATIYGYVKQI